MKKSDVARFLNEAADNQFLFMKVAFIVGLAGACRREELTYLLLSNVKDEGDCFCFMLSHTKTKIGRQFYVTVGNIDGIDMVKLVRDYITLRLSGVGHDRFFPPYRQGKCNRQPVGINTFGYLPHQITLFLKLDHHKEYTGHCFRRSSSSLLADSGADLLTVKHHGGWRSNTVAKGYIETSVKNKKKIASHILGIADIDNKDKELATTSDDQIFNLVMKKFQSSSTAGIYLNNSKDCVINIYNK